MRISARNQFKGTVKSIHKGAVNSDVIVDLGDGLEVFANITTEAVADLKLMEGRAAIAVIKSSFVLLSPDAKLRISARNRLTGVVAAVIPGAVNCEVKLQLAGTRVLTAIVTTDALNELQLVKGAPCTAFVKASHVLLAVDD
ncbi:MAG: TOBE domain-containing protein [Steroidobacteraceae bacterium]|jgi:molybdate transport system regulatory protein